MSFLGVYSMDMSHIVPLIDTGAKVALGAVITGVAIWFSLRSRMVTPTGSTMGMGNRRLEIYEAVSAELGTVAHIFSKYAALVTESYRFGVKWPESRKKELEVVSVELVEIFKNISDSEAKLLLLGEKGLAKTLRAYSARIAQFRKEVFVGRRDIQEEQINELKLEISKLKEQFYDLLSKKYDHLLLAS